MFEDYKQHGLICGEPLPCQSGTLSEPPLGGGLQHFAREAKQKHVAKGKGPKCSLVRLEKTFAEMATGTLRDREATMS